MKQYNELVANFYNNSMADISREASPMSICEENMFDVDKAVDRKKQELRAMQTKRACILFIINYIPCYRLTFDCTRWYVILNCFLLLDFDIK